MPKQDVSFDIDDALTVDQNIAAFVAKVDIIDVSLAGILSAALPALSNEIPIDQGALLDSLFAATAPAPETPEENAFQQDGGTA